MEKSVRAKKFTDDLIVLLKNHFSSEKIDSQVAYWLLELLEVAVTEHNAARTQEWMQNETTPPLE